MYAIERNSKFPFNWDKIAEAASKLVAKRIVKSLRKMERKDDSQIIYRWRKV